MNTFLKVETIFIKSYGCAKVFLVHVLSNHSKVYIQIYLYLSVMKQFLFSLKRLISNRTESLPRISANCTASMSSSISFLFPKPRPGQSSLVVIPL